MRPHRREVGLSLIEVLISMALLAVAISGALAGLVAAGHELADAHLRQNKTMLLDVKLHRMRLWDKSLLAAQALPRPTTRPDQLPLGSPPWSVDTSQALGNDWSTGAYFKLSGAGQIERATSVPAGTPCNLVPRGIYCREVTILRGLPVDPAVPGLIPQNAQAYTYWVRLSRGGDPLEIALVQREVILQ